MKKILLSLLAASAWFTAATPALASSEGPAWDHFPTERVNDLAAVQNGAKLFVNYCLNCHSASYMRFNRLRDVGLTEQQIKDNLVFTGVKVGDTMQAAIDPKEAKDWFGATPPDLTLVARSRADGAKGSGADYLYTYLRSYYRDGSKATGWNNLAFPSVAMPHALWELQGEQQPVFETKPDPHDAKKTVQEFKGWSEVKAGSLSPAQYNEAVADLVAYMQWMGEPNQSNRFRIGVWVLLFLTIFAFLAHRLNAAFWKDVK